MKAELSLPERPSALYLLVVLDVLAVLLIFFALVPAGAQPSGMRANLVEMSSSLTSLDRGKTVGLTVIPGRPPQYALKNKRVALADLGEALRDLRENTGIKTVIVSADEEVAWKVVPKLTQIIEDAGLKSDWIGAWPDEDLREEPGGEPGRGSPDGEGSAPKAPRDDASQP